MHQKDISIIGAGIGGLTMGLILKQSGYPFNIYERASEIKPVGAGIVMANNAMQVFKKMGIHHKIENAGNRISVMKITDERLRQISAIHLSRFEEKYGVHNVAIHRADLQRILAEEIGYEHIQLSKSLIEITQNEKYILSFEDGISAQTDIIIGADGIKSKVRKELFPEGTIRETGQFCWRGVCDNLLVETYSNEAYECWGKGKRFGFVKINSKQVYWYAVINESLLKQKEETLEDLFKEFHPSIREIIRITPKTSIHESSIIDLKPIHQWANKNACLMGDAAHATTPNMGQGACQAIEDAYVIGQLLSDGMSETDAFKMYQKLRISKAHSIVNNSRILGKISQMENAFGRSIRNRIFKNAPDAANYRQLDKIFNIDYF